MTSKEALVLQFWWVTRKSGKFSSMYTRSPTSPYIPPSQRIRGSGKPWLFLPRPFHGSRGSPQPGPPERSPFRRSSPIVVFQESVSSGALLSYPPPPRNSHAGLKIRITMVSMVRVTLRGPGFFWGGLLGLVSLFAGVGAPVVQRRNVIGANGPRAQWDALSSLASGLDASETCEVAAKLDDQRKGGVAAKFRNLPQRRNSDNTALQDGTVRRNGFLVWLARCGKQ